MRTTRFSRIAMRAAVVALFGFGVVGLGTAAHADDFEWTLNVGHVSAEVVPAGGTAQADNVVRVLG
jgi:hypothetical protein